MIKQKISTEMSHFFYFMFLTSKWFHWKYQKRGEPKYTRNIQSIGIRAPHPFHYKHVNTTHFDKSLKVATGQVDRLCSPRPIWLKFDMFNKLDTDKNQTGWPGSKYHQTNFIPSIDNLLPLFKFAMSCGQSNVMALMCHIETNTTHLQSHCSFYWSIFIF